MKDREARDRIAILELGAAKQWAEIAVLKDLLKAQRAAFDAFFDAVAEDLGYVAEKDSLGVYSFLAIRKSPRQLATTASVPGTVIRNPTARCKRKP